MRTLPNQINPALWEDLQHRLETGDLVRWLEVESERVARLGLTERRCVAFSTTLLRDRDVFCLRAKPYLPGLQTIVPTPQGYEINFNPYQQLVDRRFGIAHELAHTFWFAPGLKGLPLSPLQKVIGPDETIEWLCNRAAAAILLPRSEIAEMLTDEPTSLHQIPSLAKSYLVPERMVARRIFHDLGGKDFSLLAARLDRGGTPGRGHVAWFAPTPNQRMIKTQLNRVFPSHLLPDAAPGQTTKMEIDMRWWLLSESAYSRDRAKPLARCSSIGSNLAWVGRCGETWYFALPSRKNEGSKG
jgi:hypothetical protein